MPHAAAGVAHVAGRPWDHVPMRMRHRLPGGVTTLDNLCLSCFRCNAHKGPNLASVDPATAMTAQLFHPRRDSWDEHFHWDGPVLVGNTPTGRAIIRCLAINHPDGVILRELLMAEGRFPG